MTTDKIFIERNLFNRLQEYERRLVALERRTASLPDLRSRFSLAQRNRSVEGGAAVESSGDAPLLGPFSNAAGSDHFQADDFDYAPTLTATRVFLYDPDTHTWWRLRVREINGLARLTIARVSEEEVG